MVSRGGLLELVDKLPREATQVEIKKGIKHCHSNHPIKFEDDQTVYGIIVPSTHAAVRAIAAAKGSTPMHYSMINIPTNGLKCVKLILVNRFQPIMF